MNALIERIKESAEASLGIAAISLLALLFLGATWGVLMGVVWLLAGTFSPWGCLAAAVASDLWILEDSGRPSSCG
jgi:fatty acid desaturase